MKFGAGWRGVALAIIEDRRRIEEGNLVRFLIAKQPAQMVQSPKGCCVLALGNPGAGTLLLRARITVTRVELADGPDSVVLTGDLVKPGGVSRWHLT